MRSIYPGSPARAILAALALAALAMASGCDGSRQGFGGEDTTEPSASETEPPADTQPSPRNVREEQASEERYEGLEVGEPATFENGLVVAVEEALLVEASPALEEQLEPGERLVTARLSMENANPEGQAPFRAFNVTTALWQARDQNGNPLKTLYPLETSLIAGELPAPSPDYPYLNWQGELRPAQRTQGSMLFAVLPSTTEIRVRFTHPVMGPAPFAEWELGSIPEPASL